MVKTIVKPKVTAEGKLRLGSLTLNVEPLTRSKPAKLFTEVNGHRRSRRTP